MFLPGTNEEDIDLYYDDLPVSILLNSDEIQAVIQKNLQIAGIVFYRAGEFQVNQDLTISVDHPVLTLVNMSSNSISVSDPTAKLKEVTISLRKTRGDTFVKTIMLPAGPLAGKSLTVDF